MEWKSCWWNPPKLESRSVIHSWRGFRNFEHFTSNFFHPEGINVLQKSVRSDWNTWFRKKTWPVILCTKVWHKMRKKYNRNLRSVSNVNFHIIFCPKYRKPFLWRHRKKLRSCFRRTCVLHRCHLRDVEIMPDHVHMFVSVQTQFNCKLFQRADIVACRQFSVQTCVACTPFSVQIC